MGGSETPKYVQLGFFFGSFELAKANANNGDDQITVSAEMWRIHPHLFRTRTNILVAIVRITYKCNIEEK